MEKLVRAIALAVLLLAAGGARAEDAIKVGLILEYSGPFADATREVDNGVKLFMAQHGESVAGKRIEIVRRDSAGPNPEVAKRLAQELVTREKVSFLAGFGLTPNALAAADIATAAKVPMIVMNAATSIITTKSPYIARVSFTLPQVTMPLAQWAAKSGIKEVYVLASDYAPGHDAANAFAKAFTAAGGRIAGELATPLANPDFSIYVQKIKDAKPQAVFLFVPSGQQPTALLKAMAEQGLIGSGMKILATGDVTDDMSLNIEGDAALGMITAHHYSYAHDGAANKAFVKAYADAFGSALRPDFLAVGGYDGMAAIYAVVEALHGDIDADKAMAVLKGLRIDSPRGPILIDPVTRDVVQTVYIRRVERVAGELVNVEFDRMENVRDPGKP